MALVGMSWIFGPVSTFSTTRYKSLSIGFDNTKTCVTVDLYPLYHLSFYFGVI